MYIYTRKHIFPKALGGLYACDNLVAIHMRFGLSVTVCVWIKNCCAMLMRFSEFECH